MSPPGKKPTESMREQDLITAWLQRMERNFDEKFLYQEKQNDRIIDKVAELMGKVNDIEVKLASGGEVIAQLREKDKQQDEHFESTDKLVEDLKQKVESKFGHYVGGAIALLTAIFSALIAFLTGKTPTPPTGHGP